MRSRIFFLSVIFLLPFFWKNSGSLVFAQNVGVNTDGSSPETGVMLDVKIPVDKAATVPVGTFFQLKSLNTSGNELKLRLGLKTDATQANRYGFMDLPDFTAGTPAYLNLALQPSGGNVGIGTISPTEKLDVAGNIIGRGELHFSSNSATVPRWRITASATDLSVSMLTTGGVGGGNNFVFNSSGAPQVDRLYGQNSGIHWFVIDNFLARVGIGTANPLAKLHVEGATAFFRNSAVNSSGVEIYGGMDGASSSTIYMKNSGGNISTFFSDGTYNSFLNYLGGNVGIGTNNPLEKLHVNGNIEIGINTLNSPTVLTYRFYAPDNTFTTNQASGGNTVEIGAGNMTSTVLPIFGNPITAGSLVLKAGNVGDLGNNGTGVATFNAGNIDLYGGYSTSGILAGSVTRNAGNIRFFTSTNATNDDVTFTERMRVSANGRVGIGTTAPNTTLQVAGGLSLPITVTATSMTLNSSHYTVVMTATGQTITYPAAAPSNAGWIFNIVASFGAGALTTSSYISLSGVVLTTVAPSTNITIQSDGSNWYQIR